MGDEITINTTALDNINAELSRLQKEGVKLSSRLWKNIGTGVQGAIDRRYKYAGPNTSGKKPVKGILYLSAYNRSSATAAKKKRYAKIISQDREHGTKSRLSVSEALPLVTTRASMTSMTIIPKSEDTEGGVKVSPTFPWIQFHHPTSFTGIGRGINIDRGTHFLDGQDEKNASGIIGREVDRQMDKTAQTISSRGAAI